MSPKHVHMDLTTHPVFTVTRRSRFVIVFGLVGVLLVLTGCQASSDSSAEDSDPTARELVDLRGRVLSYTRDLDPDGPYSPPGEEERARLARGVGSLLEGDAREAERLLAPVGLGVTRLTDTESGRRYDEVAATGPGESDRWGRLYLNADSRVRWNAQVPHPVSDRDTEELGVRLLEDTPGGALVLAGAHRRAGRGDAADVAHREDSAFHGIVLELQERGVPGIQLHGFAESTTGRFDAVLSTGAAESAPGEVSALADRMESEGLRVCRGWSARCPLEGTTNVQGRAAQRQHATFVHLELAPDARGDGRDADEAADAVAGLLGTWAGD
ncbi:hypothetical protein [Streptomyces sp. b94]|uniref:hypothetical protein n=1 Tax=Streptomyces sp. b94 TaxID=1827634 RepID=UPI001FFD1903|nr:hypothetical protein [Streptomyces sp. b94]